MKLTILSENDTSRKNNKICTAEWGLSVYLQTKDVNILFDTGHTGNFKNNAKNFGINLDDTDFIVFSHYHWDHTKGLLHHEFTEKKKLILHPEILEKVPDEDAEKYKKDFDIIATKEVFELSPGVFYLGQIPRKTDYEDGSYNGDPMMDDSAIAIKTSNGVLVLTGCSHSGVCNISEYAKQVTGQELYGAIGGFHLFETQPQAVEGTIKYFKQEKPKLLYPMHCVDFPTMVKFYNEFGIKKYGTGEIIELQD